MNDPVKKTWDAFGRCFNFLAHCWWTRLIIAAIAAGTTTAFLRDITNEPVMHAGSVPGFLLLFAALYMLLEVSHEAERRSR